MTFRSALALLPVVALLGSACAPATAGPRPRHLPPRQATAADAAGAETGLFGVRQVGDRLTFAIPDSLLGREMIVLSRLAAAQEGLALGGDRLGPNILVTWERQGDRILLRAPSHESRADERSNLYLAVQNSAFAPVLAAFDIRERRGNASVIDVTDLYMGDGPTFGLDRGRRQRFGVRRYDRDRSTLELARAFPRNVEIRALRTYEADNPPSERRGGTISYVVNHSMVLLPEEPMQPRLYDERVGYISTGQIEYADDGQGVRNRRYIRRFRLEPSDTAAFRRGELVEPVEPIVWYIDPATPEWMIPYFEEGLLEWNAGFEDAGFRNAIQVRVAPTEEEDPDFSLLDARHSVVRYVATPVRSANATGDVVDPRSGEVIRGHINMYHGVQERLRWWLLSQVGAANPELAGCADPPACHGRGASLRGLARDGARGRLPAQPAGEFRLPGGLAPQRGLRGAVGPLGLVRGPHPLQLRRPAGRRNHPRAPHRRLGPLRDPLGVPADPRCRHARGGAADPQPVDRRAGGPPLVPLRLSAVRHGHGVGPVPDDRGDLGRSGGGGRATG
jgi:hypothetical protein